MLSSITMKNNTLYRRSAFEELAKSEDSFSRIARAYDEFKLFGIHAVSFSTPVGKPVKNWENVFGDGDGAVEEPHRIVIRSISTSTGKMWMLLTFGKGDTITPRLVDGKVYGTNNVAPLQIAILDEETMNLLTQ